MQPDEPSGYRIDPEQDAPPPGYAPPPSYAPPPAYGQPGPYAPPPGYIPPSYGPPPGYGSSPYVAQPYGAQPHGGQPYGAPAPYGQPAVGWYGAPPAWNAPPPSSRWPYGPDRPGMATAAAVLGFVTAGLSLLAGIGFLISETTGDGDAASAVLTLGIPCAVAAIVGGIQLVRRRSRTVLLVSALAAVAVLIGALIAAAVALSSDDFGGFVIFFVVAVPLPILTAVFASRGVVSSWLAAANAPPQVAPPYAG